MERHTVQSHSANGSSESRPESPAADVTTPLNTPPPAQKNDNQEYPQEQHYLQSYQNHEQPGLIPVPPGTTISPGKVDHGMQAYNNEQKEVLLDQQGYGAAPPYAEDPSGKPKILGMRRKTFWIVFGIVLAVIVIGAAVGGGVGGGLSAKHHSESPKSSASAAAAKASAAAATSITTTAKLPDHTITVTQIAPGAKTVSKSTSPTASATKSTSTASQIPDSGCPKSNGTRTIPIDPYTNNNVMVDNTVQRYETICDTDWPSGPSFGNPGVMDVWVDNLVTGQDLTDTMANCMLLCAWYNSNFNSTNKQYGDTKQKPDGTGGDMGFMPGVINACRAVVLEIRPEGRCWLKNATGNSTQYSTYEVDGAVLVT
ncbi:hypothetical protein L228DRAFT_178145 [Xylona heveae TC161]|uniref:Uncharacterized protein n=1 Tax=Xylona heveae (strain CBS 132557 / TC161) TaxID=1328760 RepID=A0A165F9F1_XYLHT|nr:hypothetical protein L228DRAFT_178145 [Xylona heveae TC161]KZF20732.1 hypothetical protein L228DRAFT_178145 [Xylona heveae TC161]